MSDHPGDRRARQMGPLGEALEQRVDDVLSELRAAMASAEATARLVDREAAAERWEVARLATLAVARWLREGSVPSAAESDRFAALGTQAAKGSVSMALLMKVHLHWRDAVIRILREECERHRLDRSVNAEAETAVKASTDASMVRMGRQFDSELEELNSRLSWMALHDSLTDLFNRTVFLERLAKMVERARRKDRVLAVYFVDLDNFKDVNDRLGHASGDILLVEVGQRLRTVIRSGDELARFGGDEFVAACQITNSSEAEALGERLRLAVAHPVEIDGALVMPTASVGIAVLQGGASTAEHALRAADNAMYAAKRAGRDRVRLVTS